MQDFLGWSASARPCPPSSPPSCPAGRRRAGAGRPAPRDGAGRPRVPRPVPDPPAAALLPGRRPRPAPAGEPPRTARRPRRAGGPSGRTPVHALRHAERAGDPGLLAELLHRSGVALLLAGELGQLGRGLAAVGDGARSAIPGSRCLHDHLPGCRSLPDARGPAGRPARLAELAGAGTRCPARQHRAPHGRTGAIDPPASPLPAGATTPRRRSRPCSG